MTDVSVARPEEQDFILSSLSPSAVQKRLAIGVVLILGVAFLVIAGPLSRLRLPTLPAFVPLYATAMLVVDSITAILLFAHFSILRSRALLVLSNGYLFTALVVIPWMLTFPDVFAPQGLLGAGLQTTSWLYILWHAGFPMFVIAYVVLKDRVPARRLWLGSVRTAILWSVALTAAAVWAATLLVTAGADLLPSLTMSDRVRFTPLWSYAAGFTLLSIAVAMLLLWIRRRSTLDLWLMAVMWACAIEIALMSFPIAARFSVGWHVGRICGLVSGSLLLFVLLHEITSVYARLQNARLQSDLQRNQAFLAEAQSISSTGSFGWSVSSGEIHWSEQTCRIFEHDRTAGPTLESMVHRVHPDDREMVRQTLDRASREGSSFDFEHRLLMQNGDIRHVHVIARAVQAPAGEVEFVGAVTDITERKLAEAERSQLEQRLRQAEKMEAVGRLAGGIAHDFNNVLGGILAYGEMLHDEAPADSRLKRYAQNVLTAASRGRSLVEQILAYSRSQRGKHVPVDLAGVVGETLELVRASLPANIRLETGAPPSPLLVIGDATRLHQVVMNLCSNAIQAMNAGGTLRVALESMALADGRACSHGTLAAGRYVRLSVEDRGCGMSEATMARIFEPFFTTKDIGHGTGLGLALVYAIVTDLAGAIDVKSALDQGSTFTIHLPLVAPAPPGAGSA
jgi:PAS domain S-box-containing protein